MRGEWTHMCGNTRAGVDEIGWLDCRCRSEAFFVGKGVGVGGCMLRLLLCEGYGVVCGGVGCGCWKRLPLLKGLPLASCNICLIGWRCPGIWLRR